MKKKISNHCIVSNSPLRILEVDWDKSYHLYCLSLLNSPFFEFSFFVECYYNIILAWSLVFFVYSFNNPLPWEGALILFLIILRLGTYCLLAFLSFNYLLLQYILPVMICLYYYILRSSWGAGSDTFFYDVVLQRTDPSVGIRESGGLVWQVRPYNNFLKVVVQS